MLRRWNARPGRKSSSVIVLLLVLWMSCESRAYAQSPGEAKTFSLDEAVDFALKNYPAVRASLEQVNAAHADVDL